MERDIKKNSKFKQFVGRNKGEIRRMLLIFLYLFILNFILFTIDIFTESTKFFIQWPLAVSGIFFIVASIRMFSMKKRSMPPERDKEKDKGKYNAQL